MRPNITININTPYLTIDAFSTCTGLPKSTIRDMIADGRLPVRAKSADMKRGKVLINMLALYTDASEGCNISLQPNS